MKTALLVMGLTFATYSSGGGLSWATDNGYKMYSRADHEFPWKDSMCLIYESYIVPRHDRDGLVYDTVKPAPAGSRFWVEYSARSNAMYLWMHCDGQVEGIGTVNPHAVVASYPKVLEVADTPPGEEFVVTVFRDPNFPLSGDVRVSADSDENVAVNRSVVDTNKDIHVYVKALREGSYEIRLTVSVTRY